MSMIRVPAFVKPRHVVVADAGIAILVATVALLLDAVGPDHRPAGALVWDVVLALPLVVRRRYPRWAALAVAALCLLQWSLGTLASGDFVALVMLYSLGAWERRRWVLAVAVVVAEIGVVLAVSRWAPPSHALLSGLMATGTVTAAWVLGVYVRTRRAFVVSVIERAETAERERDAQDRIAVAAERTRMAREMHDIIAHSLSVMITLNDAAATVSPTTDVHDIVTQASGVGRQALAEMQRILGVLRDGPTEFAPQPGSAQLNDLVAVVRSAGPAVELVVTGDLSRLTPSADLTVYRIVQESLTNVLKHGRNVRRVSVKIVYGGDGVKIRICNDGAIVTVPADRPAGHGVTGMRERAALYAGRLQAGPIPDGGWLVSADLNVVGRAVVAG